MTALVALGCRARVGASTARTGERSSGHSIQQNLCLLTKAGGGGTGIRFGREYASGP